MHIFVEVSHCMCLDHRIIDPLQTRLYWGAQNGVNFVFPYIRNVTQEWIYMSTRKGLVESG
jgi:hypothetical protein